MQIKKISQNDHFVMKDRKEISHEQLKNEIDYYKAEKVLIKLLENNLINKEEFNKINKLNRQKFKPLLGPLMCDKP